MNEAISEDFDFSIFKRYLGDEGTEYALDYMRWKCYDEDDEYPKILSRIAKFLGVPTREVMIAMGMSDNAAYKAVYDLTKNSDYKVLSDLIAKESGLLVNIADNGEEIPFIYKFCKLANGQRFVIGNEEWPSTNVYFPKSYMTKMNESYGRRMMNESKASINYSYYNSVNPIDLLAEHLEQDLYKLCDEVTDFNCKLSKEKDVKKAASYGYKDLIAKRRLAYTKIKVIDYIPTQSNHEVICDFDILDAEYNIYDKNYADLFEPLLKKASECRLAQIEAIKKYNEQNDYTDILIAFKRASRARGVEMGKDALFSRVTRYPDTAYRVRDALTSDSIPGVTYINSKQVRQKEFYFFKINKKGTKGFLSIEASGRSYSWAVYCGDRIKKELALYGLSLNESYGRRRLSEGYSRNSSRRINENAILSNFKSVVSYARDSYVNENYHSEILESMDLRSYLMSRGGSISGANYPMNEATNVTDAKIIKDGNGTAISVKIDGKEYRYVSATKSTADLFRSFNGMLKNGYTGYKALNWLKKNALEYYASKKPSEEGRKILGLAESRRFSHRFAY